jgi:hypothetical protein
MLFGCGAFWGKLSNYYGASDPTNPGATVEELRETERRRP